MGAHAASSGGEEEAREFALALCQRSFLGIGAAADDVAAVFGRATAPTAALLARWAAQVRVGGEVKSEKGEGGRVRRGWE